MDYEKSYKKLVAKLKNARLYAQTDSTKNVLDDLLLAVAKEKEENEDERIRKTLLRCCDDWEKGQFGCMAKEDVPAIRAYLEKQKEQEPRWETYSPYTEEWTKEKIDKKYEELVDKIHEQNPIKWSEEDLNMIRFIIMRLEDYGVLSGPTKDEMIAWLNQLRDRIKGK